MSRHLSELDLKKYVERQMSGAELLAFDAHMSECDPCADKMADHSSAAVISSDILIGDAGIDEHLRYEQFEQYVDGELDAVDMEIVEVHRGVCDFCSDQINELVRLRATLEIGNDSSQSSAVPTPPYFTFWERLRAGWYLKIAAPAFGIVLLGAVLWFAWLSPNMSRIEVAEVRDPTPGRGNSNIAEINLEPDGQTNSNQILSQSVTSLSDGGSRIEMDAAGKITGLNASQFENRVKSALSTQNIEISPAAKELRSQSGVLMGDASPGVSFPLTTPVGKVIQTDRPQFRWRELKDAESYVVTIFDSNFNKVAESPSLRQAAWTTGTPLKRGAVYQWQVTAIKDGQEIKSPVRPAPDARFKVLDVAAANDIAAAKRQSGNSHLLLGILYANAGLIDDAERELQALVQKNPSSDVARRLLNKVRAAR